MTGPRLLGPGATAEEQSNYINALDKCNRGLPQEAPYRWDEKRFVYAQTLAGVIVRRLDSFPVEEIKYKPPSEYCGQCSTETPHTYSHARAGGICTVCGRLVKDIKLLVEIDQLRYINSLERTILALPQQPPTLWEQALFVKAARKANIIMRKLKPFTQANPQELTEHNRGASAPLEA